MTVLPARAQQSTVEASQTQTEYPSDHRLWQIGAYGEGGFALDYHVGDSTFHYKKEQEFYTVTAEAGRVLTGTHGPGILKGRVEALGEITPFWITHSPLQKNVVYSTEPFFNGGIGTFGAYSIHGLTSTPVLLRWNFTDRNHSRSMPWMQAGAGVLWTAKRFPQGGTVPGLNTSVFNFYPQIGVGENFFVKNNQSLNVGLHVVEYTNLGLGVINPGVPYTINFSLGYSWWK